MSGCMNLNLFLELVPAFVFKYMIYILKTSAVLPAALLTYRFILCINYPTKY